MGMESLIATAIVFGAGERVRVAAENDHFQRIDGLGDARWSASILCVGRIGEGDYQGKKQQGHTNRAGEFCPHTRAVYQNLSAPINGVRPAVSSALRQI